MASSLSRQLTNIAVSSTNPLDLRAQKNAHSQSILFDKNVAATQDFDTIYDYCVIGFAELCRLEPEFSIFSNTIFSEASKTRERGLLTASENANLDTILERFLILSCRHLLLQPTQKALEWLIRRFRVHELNIECLVLTFLIYHPLPIFSTLLSILPKQLPPSLKFLHPYRARLQPVPGHVIQHATNTNTQFFNIWSGYVIKSCRWSYQHEPMLSYWTIRMSCAVEKQLDATKVGNAQAQREREENVVRTFTNIIDKCFLLRKVPSMIIGCYIILERLVLSASLSDNVISAFMDAIANTATSETYSQALVAIAILVKQRKNMYLPLKTADFLINLKDIVRRMEEISATTRIDRLAANLALELIRHLSLKENEIQQRTLLQIIASDLLSDRSLEMVLQRILEHKDNISLMESEESIKSSGLRELVLQVVGSHGSPRVVSIVQNMIESSGLDQTLVSAIQAEIGKTHEEEAVMAIEDTPLLEMAPRVSTSWLDLMPTSGEIPISYLVGGNDDYFNKLAAAFTQASGHRPSLEEFLATKPLNKTEASTSSSFVSFFARFWCSPAPTKVRVIAISCVAKVLEDSSQILSMQVLLPYLLTALADPAKAIRAAATKVLMQLNTIFPIAQDTIQIDWNVQQFYGRSETVAQLTLAQLQTIVQDVLLRSLEEIKMDHLAVQQSICNCLTGSSSVGLGSTSEKLKKTSRSALLKFLADHANATPVLRTKLALLNITDNVHKAGHLSRYEAFETFLQTWALIDEAQLQKTCSNEKLAIGSFCSAVIKIVPAASATGNRLLQKLSSSVVSKTFLEAMLDYVRTSWSHMDDTIRSEWALLFFEYGVLHRGKTLLSEFGLDTLTSLQLSTEILEQFLEKIMALDLELEHETSNTKRRKLANGTSLTPLDVRHRDLKNHLTNITASLDLIRNAGSAAKCTLLPALFRIFQDIQRSKSTLQNDLNYVHWLLLTCLREIISNTDRPELNKIDHSYIRIDLVVDTLTHTVDPETQYAALLFLSSLAKLEPELIVHGMMPVFTFIGSNILKQDNDHAAHVVNQTIDSVIPPLVASFRQQKGGSLAGIAGLVSSFVAAFEHISPGQRLDLFAALADKLGPEEYLSVIFVVLQDRYGDQNVVKDFVSSMLLKYTAVVQFKTIHNCLDILTDSLEARPKFLKQLFAIEEGQDHEKRLFLLAKLPSELLQVTQLMPKVTKALRGNGLDAQIIRSSYSEMVQQVLKLTLQEQKAAQLTGLITTILSTLIGAFPVSESLQALNVVLQHGTEELHQKVLDTFAHTIARAQPGDTRSCNVCYELLPSLVSIIKTSINSQVQQNTIQCMDSIIKIYGKVDTSKSLEIAQFLAGPLCLQSSDTGTQIATLKALATMVTALGEEILPVSPTILSKSLDHLAGAIVDGHWNSELHNAVYSVFGTLLQVIPWIVTGDKLNRLLELSYISTSNSPDTTCDDQRVKTLSLLAKKADPVSLFTALNYNWTRAVNTAYIAASEHLQILEMSIDRHTKSVIAANTTVLIEHFINVMDLGAMDPRASLLDSGFMDWDEASVLDIEKTSSSILIKMIYKLNDAHFRPLFIKMSEWATANRGKDQLKTIRKLVSWFSFLHKFFSTLQSIVINYTVYILDTAIETLKEVSFSTRDYELLWQKTILVLHATFEHDQDDFWKSPARFSDLCTPLIAQLQYITADKNREILIPCITAFAVAVESAEHRAEIHRKVLEHFNSDNAAVRRNMFACQISLTRALGEEWIALFDSSSTYPVMSEAFEDDDEEVENEARRWKLQIEDMTGESLDTRLQ